MNYQRILAVAKREWQEIYRDRLFLSLAFVFPITMMIAFAYGLSLDVEDIPIAVLDQDRSELSREYIHCFKDSRYFKFKGYLEHPDEIDELLTTQHIRAAIVIPEHFQSNLLEGRPAPVQHLLDGTFTTRARTVKGYMTAITRAFEKDILINFFAKCLGVPPQRVTEQLTPIKIQIRYLYSQAVESSQSLPPRLMVLVLLVASPFLTVVGIVREKENGSIYNMYASNVSRTEYLIGKLMPYMIIATINAFILWVIAVVMFQAPFKGSAVLFVAATLLYVLCTTLIGLVISVFVRTQVAGVLITAILTIVGGTLYSGVLTPVSMLSEDNQLFCHLLPAMYYTEIVDGVFLRNVGLTVLWPNLLVLAVYSALLLVVGYTKFTKRPKT